MVADSVPFTHVDPKAASADAETLRRTAWFRDAKYGMLITWGIYALPAGEWNGIAYSGLGEWLMHSARIPVAEYARLAADFMPLKFDAEAWIRLAKTAGMKYVVVMAKHHDGFAMFHSRATAFNIVDATPFRRDPMAELAAACRKLDMPLGFYYSQSQDWSQPGGAILGGSWDPAQEGDFDVYIDQVALPQVRELLTNYGPVAMMWFDTPVGMTPERSDRFVKLVRELQPKCLINGRLDITRQGYDYASMRDNQVLEAGFQGAWETPATINDTWGYKKADENWKPADTILYRLVDVVSKGGNYLLNVGPNAEGVIPARSVAILQTIGQWLQVNGEAIYGAGPTLFGAELASSAVHDTKFVYRKPAGWRCTTKDSRLYIHLFDCPGGTAHLSGMASNIRSARFLANNEPAPVVQKGCDVEIHAPAVPPGDLAVVLRLDLERSNDMRRPRPLMRADNLEIHIAISPTAGFFNRVHYFAASLRARGGAFGSSRIVVTVGADQPPEDLSRSQAWSKRYPIEWRWLDRELFRRDSYYATAVDRFCAPFRASTVLMLDADILVHRNFEDLIEMVERGGALFGMPALGSPWYGRWHIRTNEEWWQALFDAAGLGPTPYVMEHTSWGIIFGQDTPRLSPPYMNFGVLAAPAELMQRLGTAIYGHMHTVDRVVDTVYRCQLALTLAIVKQQLPWKLLPVRYNFPNYNQIARAFPEELGDVRLLHYLNSENADLVREQDLHSPQSVESWLPRPFTGKLIDLVFRGSFAGIHGIVAAEAGASPSEER